MISREENDEADETDKKGVTRKRLVIKSKSAQLLIKSGSNRSVMQSFVRLKNTGTTLSVLSIHLNGDQENLLLVKGSNKYLHNRKR
jgi:hypothetical protein